MVIESGYSVHVPMRKLQLLFHRSTADRLVQNAFREIIGKIFIRAGIQGEEERQINGALVHFDGERALV